MGNDWSLSILNLLCLLETDNEVLLSGPTHRASFILATYTASMRLPQAPPAPPLDHVSPTRSPSLVNNSSLSAASARAWSFSVCARDPVSLIV